jgi:murein DD-endopeptidase MepM/ murein hydrolase activator NlpD
MQLLITHGTVARTRVLHIQRWQLLLVAALLAFVLMLASGAIYHFVFLTAAREGWPVVSPIVRLIVRDEIAQRDRFMRENLDAMAQRVGQMQAKLVKLEAMGERVSSLAGMKAEELKPLKREGGASAGGRGGPFVPLLPALPLGSPSLDQLHRAVAALDESADWHTDLFTYFEARLQESRLAALMVPSAPPVDGPVGSGFGFRTDPINGRAALHNGLDFPAEVGTPITAAAGGIVVKREWHEAYGNVLEIDHGNGLVTRYAHCSSIEVPLGALVKRGQLVAKVGNTGRSTGSHLHFEVLVDGAPQDPARFLAAGSVASRQEFAARPGRR